MTCKENCLCYPVCVRFEAYAKNPKLSLPNPSECNFFKDRSKIIELPDLGEYTTVTTLDEAIDHCFSIVNSTDDHICAECKAEHMRLCGWLGELKSRVEAEQALKGRNNKCAKK